MPPLLLYSTNTFLKYWIQLRFRNDEHHVWCSEYFDATRRGAYSQGVNVAASSNPADIYQELKRAVNSKDEHCAKISAQRLTLTNLAAQWAKSREINGAQKRDIMYMVRNAQISDWRPLLFVIPGTIEPGKRLQLVSPSKRANPLDNEYVIKDLKANEFHIIELP